MSLKYFDKRLLHFGQPIKGSFYEVMKSGAFRPREVLSEFLALVFPEELGQYRKSYANLLGDQTDYYQNFKQLSHAGYTNAQIEEIRDMFFGLTPIYHVYPEKEPWEGTRWNLTQFEKLFKERINQGFESQPKTKFNILDTGTLVQHPKITELFQPKLEEKRRRNSHYHPNLQNLHFQKQNPKISMIYLIYLAS